MTLIGNEQNKIQLKYGLLNTFASSEPNNSCFLNYCGFHDNIFKNTSNICNNISEKSRNNYSIMNNNNFDNNCNIYNFTSGNPTFSKTNNNNIFNNKINSNINKSNFFNFKVIENNKVALNNLNNYNDNNNISYYFFNDNFNQNNLNLGINSNQNNFYKINKQNEINNIDINTININNINNNNIINNINYLNIINNNDIEKNNLNKKIFKNGNKNKSTKKIIQTIKNEAINENQLCLEEFLHYIKALPMPLINYLCTSKGILEIKKKLSKSNYNFKLFIILHLKKDGLYKIMKNTYGNYFFQQIIKGSEEPIISLILSYISDC